MIQCYPHGSVSFATGRIRAGPLTVFVPPFEDDWRYKYLGESVAVSTDIKPICTESFGLWSRDEAGQEQQSHGQAQPRNACLSAN
jgi:hypothetical protein